MSTRIDIDSMLGQRYGRLVILKRDKYFKHKLWALCDCGKESLIIVYGIKNGTTKSCGCLHKEIVGKLNYKHGKRFSTEYEIWCSMLKRCFNENSEKYSKYGAIGITVCDRWKDSFENFYEDMGERPENTSLNRIHGAKVYSKETCEWASYSVQSFDQKQKSTNTSGRTGVSMCKGKWLARLWYNKKCVLYKFFIHFEDAVKAREEAEIEYYGFNKQ